ncbi:DUF2523 domain-containing protein [Stutzerimonas nitrititolerans]|uniref:DUF2523 domain-containing protein n=1 Tax=Stutzerimonas nitrititolerans TaxID=2482751 RepID=UPI0028A2DAA3|nr:DUF2523 domain-containing protein [Stutzerimonas nitrititolerans]
MHFAAIFSFLSTAVGPLVKQVLKALGIGMVSYVGLQIMVDQVRGYVTSNFAGLPSDVVAVLGLAKVDIAVNIVLAAVITRAIVAGMDKASGSITKLGSVKG